jgi:hypothetical protein
MGKANSDIAFWEMEYETVEGWPSHCFVIPNHYFNGGACIVSFAGAVKWIFSPPPLAERSAALDMKRNDSA